MVLGRIARIITECTEAIADGRPPVLDGIKSRCAVALVEDDTDGSFRLVCPSTAKQVNKTLKSATSILLVMQFIARLLRTGKTCTQREVYYSFPNYFKNQQQCNDAILDCASVLGVDRERCHLRASSRGSYSGSIRLWEPGLGIVDGTAVSDAMSISSHWITNPNMEVDVSHARFILIIEKEGIFGRLVEDKFWRRLPCVIITGRGFPDLATRASKSLKCATSFYGNRYQLLSFYLLSESK